MCTQQNQRHIPVFDALVVYFYLHQNVEGPGAGAIGAGEEIVEVNAVSVVLLHDWQLKPGFLPQRVLRDVHIHVGAWMQRWRRGPFKKIP